MRQLSELLKDIIALPKAMDRELSQITLDSRSVEPGALFLACRGEKIHGAEYKDSAIAQGATAILCETEESAATVSMYELAGYEAVPIIHVPALTNWIGILADRFYDHPSKSLKIVAVTGTNGKTSITQYLAAACSALGWVSGVMGTLGYGVYGELHPGTHTTPDVVTVHHYLAMLREKKAQLVAMEVSSHGLVQKRIAQVDIDIAIFTNLTRDHLDYHENMQAYGQAKRQLFLQPGLQYAVINLDDPFGRQLAQEFSNKLSVVGYTTCPKAYAMSNISMVYTDLFEIDKRGMMAHVVTPWGSGELRSKLLGHFNLSNLLAVLATLGILGVTFSEALAILGELKSVPGRLQMFGGGEKPLVVVDYAHTPDALEKALLALRPYCSGDLWCVFGCGGDRDKGKRPIMGRTAAGYADRLVITDDNPRHENPQQIVQEIIQDMGYPERAVVEHDRRRAISHAISCATPRDLILVAGKGHENYQQVGDEKLPFSDAVEVQLLLNEISEK